MECLVRLGNGDLVWEDDDPNVAQDRPDVNESTQTTQGTRRGTHQRGNLALETDQRRLVWSRSGNPINGVLEDRRNRIKCMGKKRPLLIHPGPRLSDLFQQ